MRIAESYPGTICICVDQCGLDFVSGKFYHRYREEPVEFENPIELLFKAEQIFDQFGAPMAFLRGRRFGNRQEELDTDRRSPMIDVNKVVNHDGERATFIVNVMFRQHASWQGKICWVEGKETQLFRSALELLKLIDSALEKQEADSMEGADQPMALTGPEEIKEG